MLCHNHHHSCHVKYSQFLGVFHIETLHVFLAEALSLVQDASDGHHQGSHLFGFRRREQIGCHH
jgi:hypothetical protein